VSNKSNLKIYELINVVREYKPFRGLRKWIENWIYVTKKKGSSKTSHCWFVIFVWSFLGKLKKMNDFCFFDNDLWVFFNDVLGWCLKKKKERLLCLKAKSFNVAREKET